MEVWIEIFKGKIPDGIYQTRLVNGEEKGLVIELYNDEFCISVQFGVVQAIRMLDEGIVQTNLYSEEEIEKYKKSGFRNLVYESLGGEFRDQISRISDGYSEHFELKHYIVVTQNYCIDVLTEWEAKIDVKRVSGEK